MRFPHSYLPVVLIALLLSVAGPAVAQEPGQTISAEELQRQFENDRQTAEATFIGKTLNYTGVVVGTGMSIYLTPNVMLSDRPDGPAYVICVLPRADAGRLSEFTKGEQVTMTGRVYRGKSGGGVVVKECRRVDEKR